MALLLRFVKARVSHTCISIEVENMPASIGGAISAVSLFLLFVFTINGWWTGPAVSVQSWLVTCPPHDDAATPG